eukprot:TRINITY_DN1397_c0_g1_i1.p1 TRINITY_DN1397_c0_g1~~TRINITY_DN1397_c0_g1_i1.p1  ORF type:complete len:693 (-),score=217.93 TRINITY_DN1397_c0_g1_i1:28-2106(-)
MEEQDEQIIKETLGSSNMSKVDPTIISYLSGVLSSYDKGDGNFFDIVSPFLLASEVGSEEEIKEICEKIISIKFGEDDLVKKEDKKLKKAINMSTKSDKLNRKIQNNLPKDKKKGLINYTEDEMIDINEDHLDKKKKNTSTKKKVVYEASDPSKMFIRKVDGKGKSKDIHLRSIDIGFAGHQLIKDANLVIAYGRRYGLVGRNGTGKSTLLRAISNRELKVPMHITILHVEQEATGDDTNALDSVLAADEERQKLIEEEKQILEGGSEKNDERLLQVQQQLFEIGAEKSKSLAAKILSGLGFDNEMQQRATKTYSGGWRMRIALARALFCTPDLLLLDEPTNMLDINAKLWLENYLQTWPSTLLTVSHDRYFLNCVTTDIIHLHSLNLTVYKGNYEAFEKVRVSRLKNQQKSHEAQQKQKEHVQKFIDRFRFNAKRASLVQSRIKMLKKMEVISAVIEDPTCAFSFPETVEIQNPIIEVKEASFHYPNTEKNIFTDLKFTLLNDSRIAFVGANGQGKSTLLKLLTGEVQPTDGYININNRVNFGRFSQHHVDHLEVDLTCIEFLQKKFPGKKELEYRSYLGKFGISGELALQQIRTLSGGQKSRLQFAIMSYPNPNMLILDEPENHLDVETVDILAQALNDYNGAILLVTHNERLIRLVCNDLWIIDDGRIIEFEGDFDDYRRKLIAIEEDK